MHVTQRPPPDGLALEPLHVLGADLARAELAAQLIVNGVHCFAALQEAREAVNQVREAPNDVLQAQSNTYDMTALVEHTCGETTEAVYAQTSSMITC
jgi:hypothetical protein